MQLLSCCNLSQHLSVQEASRVMSRNCSRGYSWQICRRSCRNSENVEQQRTTTSAVSFIAVDRNINYFTIRAASRKIRTIFDDDDEEMEMKPHASNRNFSSRMEKKRAVELISDLLQLNDGPMTSNRKKPLANFTDDDFAREEKELAIKKARVEIKNFELRQELCERLLTATDKLEPFLSKSTQLMDLMVAEKSADNSQRSHLVPVEVLTMASHSNGDETVEHHQHSVHENVMPHVLN